MKHAFREWKPEKKWNPFNSFKVLAHVERWKGIKRGLPLPSPVLITIDPTNRCNLNCVWCNAAFLRKQTSRMLSKNALLKIANFLPKWGHSCRKSGVQAICIAGGGEPTLNPHLGEFIDRVSANDIEIGIVSNGTMLSNFIDALGRCVWVGISLDAGTSKTFNKLKGLPPGAKTFDQIINNIGTLIDYSRERNYTLAKRHPSYGVSLKYLLYKDNVSEIYKTAKLAKKLGCKNMHIRPSSTSWDKMGTSKEIIFTKRERKTYEEQITKTLELDDENFNVFGVTHKFTSQFRRDNRFTKCHAIFMTAVITPSFKKDASPDGFALSLCCDRRGDERLELGSNIVNGKEINRLWGGNKHWNIYDSIRVNADCPRCTYQPHNEVFEQVILNDSMTYKFI